MSILRCAYRQTLIVIILALTMTGAESASTTDKATADKTPSLWHKQCQKEDNTESCYVEQFAVSMPAKTVALHIRFDFPTLDQARIIVTAPLGIFLTSGVQLSVDSGKPIALPFERCLAQGCDMVAIIDKPALEKFEKGKTLVVRYAVSDKTVVEIPVQLEGLTEALKSLTARGAIRTP